MADDKKPQHKDYTKLPRAKTDPMGHMIITSSRPDRHDPTPPPVPGSVSNEDLAVKLKTVEKKTDDFQMTTTQRLSNVETSVGAIKTEVTTIGTKVGSLDVKVDKVTTLLLDDAAKKQSLTFDMVRMHGEVATKKEIAATEVGAQKELAGVAITKSTQLDALKAKNERRKRITTAFGAVVGLLGSGAFIHWLLGKLAG